MFVPSGTCNHKGLRQTYIDSHVCLIAYLEYTYVLTCLSAFKQCLTCFITSSYSPGLFSPTVPSAVPAFTVTSVSAVSFTLSWWPLPPCEQNGNITGYTISVTMEGMPFTERNVSANVMSIVISSLNPFTIYGVKMAASTVIGQGIFSSEVTFRTNEAGIVQPLVT